MNYVISDIHGCYSEFMKLLDKISFSEKDHLYILGNHDFFLYSMVERFGIDLCDFKSSDDKWDIRIWLHDGGLPTMDGFLELSENKRREIIEYIKEASLYEVVENNHGKFILVHAGIDNYTENRR